MASITPTAISADEYRVLRSFALGVLEAMAKGRLIKLTPECLDVMKEWLELDEVASDPYIAAEVKRANEWAAAAQRYLGRPKNRAERRKYRVN